jgi:hypothetical protein
MAPCTIQSSLPPCSIHITHYKYLLLSFQYAQRNFESRMNQKNWILVDLPLHSTHVPIRPYSEITTLLEGPHEHILHPMVVDTFQRLIERSKSESKEGFSTSVSMLTYPCPSTPYDSYFHLPWTFLSDFHNLELYSPILPAKDPFDRFLEVFDEIPNSRSTNVIWVIHSERISSASTLSYRLCQTLRYLLDMRGIRTQILIDPSATIPEDFERAISTLNIKVHSNADSICLKTIPNVGILLNPYPYSARTVRIPSFSEMCLFELESCSFVAPIAFQLISTILFDRIPLHALDGTAIALQMDPNTCEKLKSLVAHRVLLCKAVLSPSTTSETTLPEWNDVECSWEYSKSFALSLGDAFALYRVGEMVFLRKVNMDLSGITKLASNHLEALATTPLSSIVDIEADILPKKATFALLYEWIAKQAWIAVNPSSDLIPELIMDTETSSLSIVAGWMQIATEGQKQNFFSAAQQYASILCRALLETSHDHKELGSSTQDVQDEMDDSKMEMSGIDLPISGFDVSTNSSQMEYDDELPFANDGLVIQMDSVPMLPFPILPESSSSSSSSSSLITTMIEQLFEGDFPVLNSLIQVWELEVARVSNLEPFTLGLSSSNGGRRSLGRTSINNYVNRDDVSVTSSEATSEPGQTLLEAVRLKSSSSNITPSPATTTTSNSGNNNKMKTSKQLRQQLSNMARPITSAEQKRRSSLGPSVSSPRTSSNETLNNNPNILLSSATSRSGILALSLGKSSHRNSLNVSSNGSTPTTITPERSPRTSLVPPSPMAFATPRSGVVPKSPKLPPLSAPLARLGFPATSLLSSSSSSSSTSLPPLSCASSSLAESNVEPSNAMDISSHNTHTYHETQEIEDDNRQRLIACCRNQVMKVMKQTDRRFSDLVDRLFHICKIIITVQHEWTTPISNVDMVKCATAQSAQLLPGQAKKT